jgi:hypothetical protein
VPAAGPDVRVAEPVVHGPADQQHEDDAEGRQRDCAEVTPDEESGTGGCAERQQSD